jgi:alpha-1,3-rhamnosyl/mannosyltransferase
MRVIVNEQSCLGPKTGVGHYTSELLRGLRHIAPELDLDVFPKGGLRELWKLWTRVRPYLQADMPAATASTGQRPRRRSWRAGAWQCLRRSYQPLLNRLRRRTFHAGRYDLYHEPNYIPVPADCQTITTFHDLSVVLHPEWHPPDRVAWFEQHLARALAQSDHLIAGSDHTRREITRHLGVNPARVTRVYYGIRSGLRPLPPDEIAEARHRLGLPARYLLYVGTVEPRKNIQRLLEAYCALPAGPRARWPLLLVGKWGWGTQGVAEYYRATARHHGVRHLGYVPERDLAALYNGARVLLYPSLYEGFGLPPLEMMACGGAVIASTAAAVAEVAAPRAQLVDPLDVDGWRAAMQRVVSDDEWWDSLRESAAEHARPFTWERCAAETLGVYRRVCGDPAVGVPAARAA